MSKRSLSRVVRSHRQRVHAPAQRLRQRQQILELRQRIIGRLRELDPLDIQGNVLGVIDDRGRQASPIYYAEQRVYGMLGQSLEVNSHDAGDRQILLNALGQPMRTWDSRNQRFSHTYDTLRRPVDRTVSVSGGSEILLGRIVYGDLLSTPEDTNHIGRVYRVYDGAGVATTLDSTSRATPS